MLCWIEAGWFWRLPGEPGDEDAPVVVPFTQAIHAILMTLS